jgi:hypothetical protein
MALNHSAVLCLTLAAQRSQIGDFSFDEVLPREDANFYLGLIEPTAVHWCLVDGEAAPDLTADLITPQVHQGFAAMDVEVV